MGGGQPGSRRRPTGGFGFNPSVLYPPDVFPGARDVDTPYGIIKVFEWGPVNGEKVLIMQGIGTPSLGYAGLAHEVVANGYRVMTYDYFGRGHSDSPTDIPHDLRLYLSQLLLVLASSPLPWTGNEAFHLLGYSLGGGLAAAIATHYPQLLRSLTIVCPGGLVRSTTQLSFLERMLYSKGFLPDWLLRTLMRRRLDPGHGRDNANVPVEFEGGEKEEGNVKMPSWEDLMRWQLGMNEGFVTAYLSTFQHAPIYDQHDKDWVVLRDVLAQRRGLDPPPGLMGGTMCIILGGDDVYVHKHELIQDAMDVLGEDGVEIHVLEGGHEIAIAKGKEVAQVAINSWRGKAPKG
ncbi:alpha/beta-hydrolase [Sarocladium strictum]